MCSCLQMLGRVAMTCHVLAKVLGVRAGEAHAHLRVHRRDAVEQLRKDTAPARRADTLVNPPRTCRWGPQRRAPDSGALSLKSA